MKLYLRRLLQDKFICIFTTALNRFQIRFAFEPHSRLGVKNP